MFVLIQHLFFLTSCHRLCLMTLAKLSYPPLCLARYFSSIFFVQISIKEIRENNHFKGELDAGEAKIGLAIMVMLVCTLSQVSLFAPCLRCHMFLLSWTGVVILVTSIQFDELLSISFKLVFRVSWQRRDAIFVTFSMFVSHELNSRYQ